MVVWQSLLWRGGGVAACAGRFLQDTHLDDWEVADETCVRPPDETVICRRASCHGLAACFMEPSKKVRSAPVPCRWHTHRRSVGGANRRGVQLSAAMGDFVLLSSCATQLTVCVSNVDQFKLARS